MRGMGKDQGRTVGLLSNRDLLEVSGNSERSVRGRGKVKTRGGEEDARSTQCVVMEMSSIRLMHSD